MKLWQGGREYGARCFMSAPTVAVRLPACLTAALVGLAAPAAADEPACAVRLFPPGADDAWRKAAIRLDERVRTLPEASTDCQEIDVDVAEGRASLTFVTRDGRRAVREVASPDELVPTAEILFVTIPAAPPPPVAISLPPSPPPAVVTVRAPLPPAPPSPAAPEHHGPSFLFHVSGGARFGLPGVFASPALAILAGLTVSGWDFALRGQWDPAHASLGPTLPDGFRLTSWAVAASVGRREGLGPVWLTYGLGVGASHLSWQFPVALPADNSQGDGQNPSPPAQVAMVSGDKTEPRLGVYLGVSVPRRSPIRFRPEILCDAILSRMGRGLEIDPTIPPLPWWSTALSLGVEGELP